MVQPSEHASHSNDISVVITENFDKLNLVASVCIIHGCVIEKNKYMLRCNKCKLQIHYECTRLPAYQIHQFKTKGYRKYICDSCTIGIPNEIKELCDNVATSCVSSHRSENKSCEDLQIYLKEIKNLEEENRAMKKKIEELDKRQEVLRKVIKDQETTFKMKNESEDKKESQRDTNESFKEGCEIVAIEKCILESIDKLLDKKLECVAERLGKSILNELKENCRCIFFFLCIFSQVRNIPERIILISTTR